MNLLIYDKSILVGIVRIHVISSDLEKYNLNALLRYDWYPNTLHIFKVFALPSCEICIHCKTITVKVMNIAITAKTFFPAPLL